MFKALIHALRVGGSVKNPTPVKWAGVAVAIGIAVLEIAKSYGFLITVDESSMIELIMAGIVLYTQFATTDKIGILPKGKPIEESIKDSKDTFDNEEPTQTKEQTKPKKPLSGFPEGPFFSN